jgi:hypothetical protein
MTALTTASQRACPSALQRMEVVWRDDDCGRIILEHKRNGSKLYTEYTHMSAIFVSEGDEVIAGQTIGAAGDVADNITCFSEGAHLHFGVRLRFGPGTSNANIDPFGQSTPTPLPTPTSLSPVTVRISITTGLEDAGPEPSTCRYSTSWNEIYFGECANGARITSGFRFGNVPAPRDARI